MTIAIIMTIMIIIIILVAIIRIDIFTFVSGKLGCACWQIPQTGDANCHPQPIGMCDNLTDVQPTWGFLKTHCHATGRMIYIWVTSEPLNIIFSWSSKTLSMLEQPFFFFRMFEEICVTRLTSLFHPSKGLRIWRHLSHLCGAFIAHGLFTGRPGLRLSVREWPLHGSGGVSSSRRWRS